MCMLLGCGFVHARDVIFEFKTAYFRPTNNYFKQIYGNSGALFGPELSVQICDNNSNWYGFFSIDYLAKKGHSIGLCNKTRVSLLPIAIGVKYFTPSYCQKFDFYLGGGLQPTRVHTNDCSPYVPEKQTEWALGGIFKAGAYIPVYQCFMLDLFIGYSLVRVGCKDSGCSGLFTIPLKANVSGLLIGAGFGYRF